MKSTEPQSIVDGYISEHDAIQKIQELTKKKISLQEIEICARKGIIPAYLHFMPSDTLLNNGTSFHIVYEDHIEIENLKNLTIKDPGYQDEFWKILPYPLPPDNIVEATDGIRYRVLVSRNDGKLENLTNEHFIKVYTDEEVRKTAKNIKNYLTRGQVKTTSHAYQKTWIAQRNDDDDKVTVWVPSPFSYNESSLSGSTPHQLTSLKDNRERKSLHLIIAALASKAGYKLENDSQAAAMLRADLDAIGLTHCLTGKGTVQNYFKAVIATVDDAKKDY